MGTLLQDVQFALRTLRRTPAFPLAAIATLAIGIGAATAIFSTVNAVLLKPLPYPHAEDLYALRTALTDGRVTTGNLSPVEILRLNDPSLSIVRASGLLAQDVTLVRNDGTPVKTKAYAVSEGFFNLFGLPMTLGGVTDRPPPQNAPPGVIISYRVWQDLFNGDPDVVGKPLRFAEITTSVAGVAPRGFDTPHGANFWFQIGLDPQGVNHSFEGFMRVKPGTTIERVRGEMEGVMASVARDFPESARARVYVVRPLVESIVGDLGPILLVVLSATALLLILACVNVTNLMLARGAVRAREIAVRVALGAGRGRIVRQMLTESMLIASAGAAAGVVAAYAFVKLLLSIGAAQLPRLDAVPFDRTVLLFALAALVTSGVLVGFAPALRLASTDVRTLMNESTRSASGGRGTARWLSIMTTAQVALAVMLVAGAGWLVRSFDNLRKADAGFVHEGRLVFDAAAVGPRFRDGAAITAFTDLLDRLRAIPGVAGAASTFNLPLRPGPENSLFVHIVGDPEDQAHNFNSRQRTVSAGFFKALGIRLLVGREFNADDRPGPVRSAVVNRTFAEKYLAGRDPLTARFTAGYPAIDPRTVWMVVGVVDDVRQRSLSVAGEPAFYNVNGQGATFNRQAVIVHAPGGDTPSLRAAIRDEARKLDTQMAVDIERLSDVVAATISRQQLGMTLMLWFGAAAVALAAVGIYGVIAYAAAPRRNEVAIRLALGATAPSVFRLVLRQGRMLAAIGASIGLVAAYLAGRVVAAQLYRVSASDPLILGAATALVVAITLVATVIPAWRASRLDPARVLWPD